MGIGSVLVEYGKSALFFIELIALVLLGRLVQSKLSGYNLDEELTKNDNPAIAISFSGYIAGMLLALMGAFVGPGAEEPQLLFGISLSPYIFNLTSAAIWGTFAIIALNLARLFTDRLMLSGFGNVEEMVHDRNIGVGACEAGSYIASGLIVRSAIAGQGEWWTVFIYLIIGMGLLIVGVKLLQGVVFRSYNLKEEIEHDNHAAGVLLGFHILAIGYIINHAIVRNAPADVAEGSGVSFLEAFGTELIMSSVFMIVGLGALALLALITDRLMLPADKLRDEIVGDKNMGAALVSGVVALCGAILVSAIF